MGKEELGDRAGMPRQQFSVGPTLHSTLNLLDDLRGGEISMPERRTGTDADQASNLGDLQSQLNLEQEVTDDPPAGIIPLTLLQELQGSPQDAFLLIGQPFQRDPSGFQPLLERLTFRSHRGTLLVAEFQATEA
jgi:hypothetical protein